MENSMKQRRIGMRLGTKVLTGETSEIFDWGEDRIIKLFWEDYPAKAVEQEYLNSRAVKPLDFCKAKEHGIVAYGSRTGIVYEWLTGENLVEVILKKGHSEEYMNMYCELHEAILKNEMFEADVRYYKHMLLERLKKDINLDETKREEIRKKIRALPEGTQLCHGEFRPRKVIITKKGAGVVDFGRVCRGPRLFDVAVSYYLISNLQRQENTEEQRKLEQVRGQMAEEYLAGMRVMKEEIEPYLEVIEYIL